MTDVLDRILRANEVYASSIGSRPALPSRPSLGLAVITCMDCRIDVTEALGLADGEAHIIRTAGGTVTDDVLRSLVVSQWALGTEEILVIQHTGCGMIGLDEQGLRRRVQDETGVTLPLDLLGFDNLEASLRESVQRLKDCGFLRARHRVMGLIFDLDTRRLLPVS